MSGIAKNIYPLSSPLKNIPVSKSLKREYVQSDGYYSYSEYCDESKKMKISETPDTSVEHSFNILNEIDNIWNESKNSTLCGSNTVFTCMYCNKIFDNRFVFDYHVKIDHDTTNAEWTAKNYYGVQSETMNSCVFSHKTDELIEETNNNIENIPLNVQYKVIDDSTTVNGKWIFESKSYNINSDINVQNTEFSSSEMLQAKISSECSLFSMSSLLTKPKKEVLSMPFSEKISNPEPDFNTEIKTRSSGISFTNNEFNKLTDDLNLPFQNNVIKLELEDYKVPTINTSVKENKYDACVFEQAARNKHPFQESKNMLDNTNSIILHCKFCSNFPYVNKELLFEHLLVQHIEELQAAFGNNIFEVRETEFELASGSIKKEQNDTVQKYSQNIVKTTSKIFHCKICSFSSDLWILLFQHLIRNHQQQLQAAYEKSKVKKPHWESNSIFHANHKVCRVCFTTIGSKESLYEHMMTHSEQELVDFHFSSSRSTTKVMNEKLQCSNTLDNAKEKDCTKSNGNHSTTVTAGMTSEYPVNQQLVTQFAAENSDGSSCKSLCNCFEDETIALIRQVELTLQCKTCNSVLHRTCNSIEKRQDLKNIITNIESRSALDKVASTVKEWTKNFKQSEQNSETDDNSLKEKPIIITPIIDVRVLIIHRCPICQKDFDSMITYTEHALQQCPPIETIKNKRKKRSKAKKDETNNVTHKVSNNNVDSTKAKIISLESNISDQMQILSKTLLENVTHNSSQSQKQLSIVESQEKTNSSQSAGMQQRMQHKKTNDLNQVMTKQTYHQQPNSLNNVRRTKCPKK